MTQLLKGINLKFPLSKPKNTTASPLLQIQAAPDRSAAEQIVNQQKHKIRVLLLITRLTIGGDTNVVLDLADHLNHHPNFEVTLAVGPVPDCEIDLTHLAYQRGIPTRIIPDLINAINPAANLRAVQTVRALILEGKYDVVHTHSSVAGVVGRIAAASTRVPVIVHHVHGWGLREDMSFTMRSLYLTLERLCAPLTSRLIAVSMSNIQKGLDYHICGRKKFELIYNGIDLEKFSHTCSPDETRSILAGLGLNPDYKTVGMIGRLDKQKNPLDFIRAAAIVVKEYPLVQFVIAGEGSLRPDCEALIQELGLQGRFYLLGFRKDIHCILPALTFTALSSLWEGLPVVFQEAMSAGKAIVANSVDGATDVVIDGETGFLVTPHRPDEMADRILRLLQNDTLCQAFGQLAQQHARRFSCDQMIEKIETLYRNLYFERTSKESGVSVGSGASVRNEV